MNLKSRRTGKYNITGSNPLSDSNVIPISIYLADIIGIIIGITGIIIGIIIG